MTYKTLAKVIFLAFTALFAATGSAEATTILSDSGPHFVGFYFPPEPASEADEVGYINELITVAAGATHTEGGYTYDRTDSTLAGPFPTAVLAGADKDDSPSNIIDVTGYSYLVGKYDGPNGGGLVWLLTGLSGDVEIPTNWGPGGNVNGCGGNGTCGLSHWGLYNGTSVPDGGSTAALLGSVLVGLSVLRRKFGRP